MPVHRQAARATGPTLLQLLLAEQRAQLRNLETALSNVSAARGMLVGRDAIGIGVVLVVFFLLFLPNAVEFARVFYEFAMGLAFWEALAG